MTVLSNIHLFYKNINSLPEIQYHTWTLKTPEVLGKHFCIDELKQQNWTFTYIGAEHDIEKMAASMNIHNTMAFDKSDKDIKRMFLNESESRIKYSLRIRNGETDKNDFYSLFDDDGTKK